MTALREGPLVIRGSVEFVIRPGAEDEFEYHSAGCRSASGVSKDSWAKNLGGVLLLQSPEHRWQGCLPGSNVNTIKGCEFSAAPDDADRRRKARTVGTAKMARVANSA